MKKEIILALDVDNFDEAKKLIENTKDYINYYKVGSILFTKEGYKIIDYIKKLNKKIFLDLKFFDIPNTVKKVCSVVTQMEVDMFTIHLLGGKEMISSAIEGVLLESKNKENIPLILGVTILTSMNDDILHNELNISYNVKDMVIHLAKIGFNCGVKGFVCSSHEIEILKNEFKNEITLVVPGIRLPGDNAGDQKRVMTPQEAFNKGADFLVMGRSLLNSKDIRSTINLIYG